MKKFYSFVFAAVALVGFAACNSDSVDEAAPVQKGETVSFIATIDNTRTGLDGLQTTWVNGDKVVIGDYTFTYDGSKFSCKADGVKSLLNTEVTATYSKNGDGKVDSTAGVAGAVLEAKGTLTQNGTLNFNIKSAFLKYTYNGNSALVVSLNGESVSTQTGTDVYVAFMPEGVNTLAYTLDGVTCKSKDNFAPVAGKIYKLGEITEKVVLLKSTSALWDQGDAWFAGHFWSNDGGDAQVRLTKVSDGLYGCVVPKDTNDKDMTHVIFCRMNSKAETFKWNSGDSSDNRPIWNRTYEFGVVEAPNNCHYIVKWGNGYADDYAGFCPSIWGSKTITSTDINTYGVIGSMTDGWNQDMKYSMTASGAQNEIIARSLVLKKDAEFKVSDGKNWSNGNNYKITADGVYDVKFNTSSKNLSVTKVL